MNDKGDSISKQALKDRIKLLESKKVSEDVTLLEKLLNIFEEDKNKAELFAQSHKQLATYELRNKNGKLGKQKVASSIKVAKEKATIPHEYRDEYKLLCEYQGELGKLEAVQKVIKEKRAELDNMLTNKYEQLTIEEIKYLLFDKKWMVYIEESIKTQLDIVVSTWASQVHTITSRYNKTLREIEKETKQSEDAVKKALERMGYVW